MSFRPYPNKQVIEVRFSSKRDKGIYPLLHFNSTNVQVVDSHKHLGLVVDSKFNFSEHLDNKFT